jgi:hypothetical protein
MRFLPLAVCLPLCLCGQDAHEIVRRSVEASQVNIEALRNYAYVERRQQRWLDGSGKPKSTDARTWDVTWQEGSPYRRLVAHNGRPLSPDECQREDEKLRSAVEERRNETWDEREHRIADWRHHQEKRFEPMKEALDGFDFKIAGEEKLNGAQTWVIDGTPKPGFTPRNAALFYLPKLKARIWIDKQNFQWLKLDAETLDTVSFGAFLVRMAKGGHILLEQERVADGGWVPKRVFVAGSGRIALLKSVRGDLEITYADYKRTSLSTSAFNGRGMSH